MNVLRGEPCVVDRRVLGRLLGWGQRRWAWRGYRHLSASAVYMDNQASTRVDPRVVESMLPYFTEHYGNAHSRTHSFGWKAEGAVEKAREQVARLIGADPREVVFTSGATEANNLALYGLTRYKREQKSWEDTMRRRNVLLTTRIEHKSIIEPILDIVSKGEYSLNYIPVESSGEIRFEALESACTESPGPLLFASAFIHNEVGVINQVRKTSEYLRKQGVVHVVDGAQAVGKVDIDVRRDCIDLMSFCAHKFYGPKGIGALFVSRKPRVRLMPLMRGGGQERALRPGTVPVPLVVGFGRAAEIALEEFTANEQHLRKLSDAFLDTVMATIPAVTLNGPRHGRWPGNLNLSFAHVEGEGLLMKLAPIALSSGSACTSASLEASHVLQAMGASDEAAHSSIRFGFSKHNTLEQVSALAETLARAVKELREMSPLADPDFWDAVGPGAIEYT